MKKRAMKKWIEKGNYCYKIVGTWKGTNGSTALQIQYCPYYNLGPLMKEKISGDFSSCISVKSRSLTCRYLNEGLMFDGRKECGVKLSEKGDTL